MESKRSTITIYCSLYLVLTTTYFILKIQLALMDHLQRYREIVPNFDQFLEIQSLPLRPTARINTLKMDKPCLLERLDQEGISYRTFCWYSLGIKLDLESPGKLLENLLGYIHIQEELSMVPPLVLDPRPGEMILDLCASPGSKTCQIFCGCSV